MGGSVAHPLASSPPAQQAIQPLPFASPEHLDTQLQDFLESATRQLCTWLGSASQRSPLPGLGVLPTVQPGAHGLAPELLLAELQLVMDGSYNPNHPGALAHLDPPPLAASMAADLVCAGLNNNLLAEELSPSLTRLERSLTAWLAGQLGMPPGSGGVAASGGSLSNLMALVAARRSRGLATETRAVVVTSADAHVSMAKALAVMGLPPEALCSIAVDGDGRLIPLALEQELERLEQAGKPVIAVVATAGTTVRGAVDPLQAIADQCKRRGLWLHVDGAIGAVFGLVPKHRFRVAGLERADSITINPQKVLGITKTSSLLLLAQPQALVLAFQTGLPYMEPSWGGGHGGDTGLQGTRPAEVLKLWLGLRQLGFNGISAVLDGAIARRRQLAALLDGSERLQLRCGSFHLLAFTPRHLDVGAAEIWSQQTRQLLLQHQLMLSRPHYGGRHHLKAVLGNPHTRREHLETLASIVHTSLETLP